eukprot:7828149-Pyramimonas_sp.AAC.1
MPRGATRSMGTVSPRPDCRAHAAVIVQPMRPSVSHVAPSGPCAVAQVNVPARIASAGLHQL